MKLHFLCHSLKETQPYRANVSTCEDYFAASASLPEARGQTGRASQTRVTIESDSALSHIYGAQRAAGSPQGRQGAAHSAVAKPAHSCQRPA